MSPQRVVDYIEAFFPAVLFLVGMLLAWFLTR